MHLRKGKRLVCQKYWLVILPFAHMYLFYMMRSKSQHQEKILTYLAFIWLFLSFLWSWQFACIILNSLLNFSSRFSRIFLHRVNRQIKTYIDNKFDIRKLLKKFICPHWRIAICQSRIIKELHTETSNHQPNRRNNLLHIHNCQTRYI